MRPPQAHLRVVITCDVASLERRTGPCGDLTVLVGISDGSWLVGIVRAHGETIAALADGRLVRVLTVVPDLSGGSWLAACLVESAVRTAEIEHEVDRLLADKALLAEIEAANLTVEA